MTDEGTKYPSVLDPLVLRELIRQLTATDIDELEVTYRGARIYLRRHPGRQLAGALEDDVHGGAARSGLPVIAPLTGIFYARPSPEQPPFVSVGDAVEEGQVVALIETMKLFNEVVVDFSGEVLEVAATEGDLVEVGHPLMFIRALDREEEL